MRLKRAIARGNPTIAMATAAELPRVPLEDALALSLLLLDREPARYEAAAVRWHSRFCREVRPSLADAHLALAALHALAGPRADAAAQALLSLSEGVSQDACAEVLAGWLERRAGLPD